jgi:UDP-3-O-[3-hydroxymyristoyl] glucosamine N-acyltransferase
MTVRELASLLQASFEGEGDREIDGVASVESAGIRQISFAAGKRATELATASDAGCLLVTNDFAAQPRTIIRVKDPRAAFARVIAHFHPPERIVAGVHPSAVIAEGVELGTGVSVGPHVTIAAGAASVTARRSARAASLAPTQSSEAPAALPRVSPFIAT